MSVEHVLLFACVFALSSCEQEKHARGLDYLPDMYESPAYRSQQSQVVEVKAAVNGKQVRRQHEVPMMMAPPEGAVTRDFVTYQIAATDKKSSHGLRNPIAPTASVLKEGQAAYNIYCAVCHGNDGNAVKNSYIAGTPDHPLFAGIKNLDASGQVGNLSDGDLYHVITYGQVKMPNYRAQLLPAARWAVVHYVRALNRASSATMDLAKELQRAEDDYKANPQDMTKKTAMESIRGRKLQAERDRDLIIKGGAGDEFLPEPAAVPEYVKPQWPEK